MTLVEMGMQKLHSAPTEPYDANDLTEQGDRPNAFEPRPTLLFTTQPSAPEKALVRICRWHKGHLGSSYGGDPVNCGFGVSHSESEKSPQKVYKECHGNTHGIDFQLSAVDTDGLQNLLDLEQKTWTSMSASRKGNAQRVYRYERLVERARCDRNALGTLPYPRHKSHT